MIGKKVTVFMTEGTDVGPRIIEIGNWSGKALYTPRSSANETLNRSEFDNCGIYILKSIPTNKDYTERIYIGEAENLRKRIKDHLKNSDKDFFTEIIIFISSILTKSHIRFLESKLINEAIKAKSAEIENSNLTGLPFLPEAEVSDMIYFLEQIRLILPLAGFRFLIPTAISDNQTIESEKNVKDIEYYHIKHSTLIATMYEDDKGFIVKKGSQANKNLSNSITQTYRDLKKKLISDGSLIEYPDLYIFNNDVVFNSISAASNIVLGRQSNGNTEWINNDEKSYKQRQLEIYAD